MTLSLREVGLRCLVAGLLLLSLAIAAKGLRCAWLLDGDDDMQLRLAEYGSFRRGVYPTHALEPAIPQEVRVPYTVYPPYALPMFVPFFEPFGKLQGRIVVELLSLASFVAIGAYGHRLLSDAGPTAGWLGAFAAAAISGNGTVFGLGQFSILSAGAILMQIVMLERGRPLAAGAWWSLAMIKPQIGLAFAGLFLVRREWRGLACGLGILGGLTLIACWWTEVPLHAVVNHWLFRMNVQFAAETSMPGRLAEAIGVPPRVLHLATAALLIVIVPILCPRRLVAAFRLDPLFLAGVASLFGGVLLYHLFYDNVMLFPFLFVTLAWAARRPVPHRIAIAAVLAVSLWMPQQVLDGLSCSWLPRSTAWIACAIALAVSVLREAATDADSQAADAVA